MPSGWLSLRIPINNKINQTHTVRPAGTGPRELLASKVIIFSLPYFSLEHGNLHLNLSQSGQNNHSPSSITRPKMFFIVKATKHVQSDIGEFLAFVFCYAKK